MDLTPIGLTRSHRLGKQWPLNNHNVFAKMPVLAGYNPMENRFHLEWVKDPLLTPSRRAASARRRAAERARPGESRIWFSPEAAEVPLSDGLFRAFRERAQRIGNASAGRS